MEILSNECFDLINGFFGNEPKLKLTISDVLALHTNDWLNCVFPYLQSQVTEKKVMHQQNNQNSLLLNTSFGCFYLVLIFRVE
jgi:hypothetical protein